jgi:hypothetical protein
MHGCICNSSCSWYRWPSKKLTYVVPECSWENITESHCGQVYVSKQLPDYPSTLVGVQDPEEHRRRRKVWNRALSTAAVKGYEEILESRVNQLIEELDKLASRGEVTPNMEPVDLSSWFSRFAWVSSFVFAFLYWCLVWRDCFSMFSFDFMGDIAWVQYLILKTFTNSFQYIT